MSGVIKSGDSGNTATVFDNRLNCHTVEETEEISAIESGNAYNLNTGTITLTGTTGMIYLKSNETLDIIIKAIAVGIGTPSGGNAVFTGEIPITVIRNPTTGTLIESTPTNIVINQNRNFGSNNVLDATVYGAGATGDTITNGDDILLLYMSGSGRLFTEINLAIPKGSTIGLKIDLTNLDATNVPCYAALIAYIEPAHGD